MSKYLSPEESTNKSITPLPRTGRNSPRTRNAFVMAIIAVAILLLVVSSRWTRPADVTMPGEQDESVALLPSSASGRTALSYVEAIQSEDFEQVFKMTQWMQERVKRLLLEKDSQSAQREIEAFYRREKEDFFAVDVRSTLTEEGIPDAHLFPPHAIVQVVDTKEGLLRPILDKGRAVNMVVLDVEYPPSVTAPTTANETRIDRLRAALYLTLDQKIIKASVRGNARVDYPESVFYRHLTPSETRRVRAETGQKSGLQRSSSEQSRVFDRRDSAKEREQTTD